MAGQKKILLKLHMIGVLAIMQSMAVIVRYVRKEKNNGRTNIS